MHDIKEIFVDSFEIYDVNEKHQNFDQLVYIVNKVHTEDMDTSDKLLRWSKKGFGHKFL